MPILPPEPTTYPNELFTESDWTPAGGRWWALHTKPRAEKAISRNLYARKVPFFLPLYSQPSRLRGRAPSFLPLFPSYLFVHGDEHARISALETNQVVQVLNVPDQIQLHTDLTRVFRLLSGELPLSPENGFQPGTEVQIVAGPFQGIQGKLVRAAGKTRLVVEVKFLQQGVSVEVEAWMVRDLKEASLV